MTRRRVQRKPGGYKVELLGDFATVPDLPFGHEQTREAEDNVVPLIRKPIVELPGELAPFRFYDIEELHSRPPIQWLIKGRIAVGESHVLWGKGDSYKSFVALHWSLLLAYAGHIVIYVVAEGASGMRARVDAWKTAHDIPDNPPGMLLMPTHVNLHEPRSVERWIEAANVQLGARFSDRPMAERRPVLIVFDTMARNFVGGSENNPQDVGLFVDGVERVRRSLGTATLTIHHAGKDGETERGTESLRNSSFAMHKMEKLTAQGEMRRARMTCDRMKDFSEPVPLDVEFRVVEIPGLYSPDGDPVSSLVAANENVEFPGEIGENVGSSESAFSVPIFSPTEQRVIEWLDERLEVEEEVTVKELCVELDLSREPVRKACATLSKLGLLGAQGTTRDRTYRLLKEIEIL